MTCLNIIMRDRILRKRRLKIATEIACRRRALRCVPMNKAVSLNEDAAETAKTPMFFIGVLQGSHEHARNSQFASATHRQNKRSQASA
jgi:hypothetical protein